MCGKLQKGPLTGAVPVPLFSLEPYLNLTESEGSISENAISISSLDLNPDSREVSSADSMSELSEISDYLDESDLDKPWEFSDFPNCETAHKLLEISEIPYDRIPVENSESLPFVKITIENITFEAFIDSGASDLPTFAR